MSFGSGLTDQSIELRSRKEVENLLEKAAK